MKKRKQKDSDLVAFGQRIRKIRENKDWSQEQLAQETNLHRTYIGGIERGERNLSLRNIRKIADSLDIAIADLFAEE